ncbi:transient receptor potential cation channel subfamily V member 1-like isoform X3 [Gymnodraco acuticeps]|uniref:Transient receptor potential cation channel subfamily V member 1-like isoform X3 n=1 Tax=Gymnodraco acuticeps TaxID=8218 RepID=A0A6P8WDX9_GYMAC|nr:transient receptor potential cation channel subfamily V member 1-like isoform X3 [Gymnodraco acuticeps]
MITIKMSDGQPADTAEPNTSPEEQEEAGGNSLDWLLKTNSSERIPAPMDTNVSITRQSTPGIDSFYNKAFSREKVFEAASTGNTCQLDGLLDYLRVHDKKLTSPEFTDETNGKTALLKALLNLKDGRNDTVELLLDIAEKTSDLENLINASYKDPCYNGELPLSLAACTNQPSTVSFLMENSCRRADSTDRDSQGNTVLHALGVIADNTTENTEMIAKMYDQILTQQNKLEKKVQLETIENNQGLTPLKLAAKLGKIGLFRHLLQREFEGEEMRPLSRKFTEWVYGPVHSSLYDMSSIDTNEHNSVLELIVFGSEIPNRPEMLQIEPLRSLLEDKWDRFASKLFLINFLAYLVYLTIFTTVAVYRKEGQPPFPVGADLLDILRSVGEILSVLGAGWFFYKSITIFKRNPPTFKALYTDGFCDILFFLQAALLLLCLALYLSGRREYVGLLVLSLALAWINVLYYSRGSKQMGMYSVMIQRMILGDLLHFLCVYSVMLFGFSAAIVALMDDSPPAHKNDPNTAALGRGFGVEPFKCEKPSYNDISFTTLELFKFTIGMGDLEFTDHVQYKEVFYMLLILYIILTYILLLNMLIALMGNTVERISEESENIWNLQRAFTILDMERTLPKCLREKLLCGVSKVVCLKGSRDESRRFFRVEEMNWRQWRTDVGHIQEEDPGDRMMKPQPPEQTPGNRWNLSPLLERLRGRRRHPQPSITSRSFQPGLPF